MNKKKTLLVSYSIAIIGLLLFNTSVLAHPIPAKHDYYQLLIYRYKTSEQEKTLDDYLKNAFLPAMHKKGFAKIGVFKPVGNDTAVSKIIYVFIAGHSTEQLLQWPEQLDKDAEFQKNGSAYINAVYSNPSYDRMESILLRAFPLAPEMELPRLKAPLTERIYELRSYESATEKIYHNKVQMFNEGGEIALFKRLNFNAVFYAEVLSGSHMPNLMYLTTFENQADRDEHWKTFGNDPEWKTLSALPQYQKNVSKADILLLHPASYSDF